MFAAVALISGVATIPAQSASLDTDVDVTLPSVISLYCYDQVKVRLRQFDVDITGSGPGLSRDAQGSPGNWDVEGPPMPYNTFNATGIVSIRDPSWLRLSGVCAFRALAGTSGVQVSIAPLNTVLEGPNNTSITLSRYRVRDAESGGAYSSSYTVDTTQGGLNELHNIDIRMRMQMTPVLYYGTYSSPSDGTFSVTVIANP